MISRVNIIRGLILLTLGNINLFKSIHKALAIHLNINTLKLTVALKLNDKVN